MSKYFPIIVAHRGLHKNAAENSIGAFIAAAHAGIPWVELDVWPSADGVSVVIHDETIDRTTTGSGKVLDHSWNQLQDLRVPSLADVLAVLSGKTGVLVEIKPPDAAAFVGSVRSLLRDHAGEWMIQSFCAKNVAAKAECALLVDDSEKLRAAIDSSWPNIHAQYSLIGKDIVDRLHSAGRKIGAWTVDSPNDIRRMIDLGVDVLITDEPELAMQMIARR